MTLPPIPQTFRRMIDAMDAPQLDGLIDALDTPASTAVRVNSLKRQTPDWRPAIAADAGEVAWCPSTGLYLASRPAFTLDPAMHQGLYYVQEASSMIQRHVVSYVSALIAADVQRPLAMLDACAAPGGKTMCAIEALPEGSVIVANEMMPQRAAVLLENVVKHGSPQTIITRADATGIGALGPAFDIIAVDAPCSGEGMMRKEPVARTQWSEKLVADCASLQERLTTSLWDALRPGGYMIYSTCTFNRSENEAQIERLVRQYSAEPVAVDISPEWGIEGGIGADFPCMRFIPGRARGEGLFMAVVRKPGVLPAETYTEGTAGRKKSAGRNSRNNVAAISRPVAEQVCRWIVAGDWRLTATGEGVIHASSPIVDSMMRQMQSVAKVIHYGIEAGTVKSGKLIPAHGLAMSVALRPEEFDRAELDAASAIEYLRRQAVNMPPEARRGYMLATYGGAPLGFVNNLGSRSNNLYPPQWRILTSYV